MYLVPEPNRYSFVADQNKIKPMNCTTVWLEPDEIPHSDTEPMHSCIEHVDHEEDHRCFCGSTWPGWMIG